MSKKTNKHGNEQTRREFIKKIVRGAALCGAASVTGYAGLKDLLETRKNGKRPNIVFLIADDERWDMMSCSGNKYFKTPNRDKLAAEGMRFENAFVTSAVCSPSRGSFLTGKHVHQCGTQPIIHMNYTFHRSERPFPAQLHDVGYHTAHFGKWHLGEGDKKKPGYDHWAGYYALTSFFDPLLTVNGKQKRYKGFSDFVIADMASDHIGKIAKKAQPFCVYVAFGAPHYDFSYPEKLEHVLDDVEIDYPPSVEEDVTKSGKPKCIQNSPLRFDNLHKNGAHVDPKSNTLDKMTRRYMRSSLSLDESVGKIMKAIDDAGVAEDTIFVYTSDHGHMLGEHGLAAKHLAYEESARIPMIIRYPRMVKAGSVRDDIVANIDVAPTLLDLAGATIPKDITGHSMRPLLEAGNKPVTNWVEDYAFLHETCVAVRTDKHKIIHYSNVNEWELYDLVNDPYEITNLYGKAKYAKVQKDMERRLKKHIRETDFPTALQHHISAPWLLGPFAAKDADAVTAAALAAPVGSRTIIANGKKYKWKQPPDPNQGMIPEFKGAQWMWHQSAKKMPSLDRPAGRIYFRHNFTIPKGAKITSAIVQAAADNSYELYVNDKKAGQGVAWINYGTHDISKLLKPGKNVIAFIGSNGIDKPSPAGLLVGMRIKLSNGKTIGLSSGKGWRTTDNAKIVGWSKIGFNDSSWGKSEDLGPRTMSPWRTGQTKPVNPGNVLGGKPDDMFLTAFDIEVLGKRDPFVRLWFNPVQQAVTGWVNGEKLYVRHTNGNPWDHSFNPPLVPGRNRLLFQARLGDYPTVSIRVHGHEGKTRIME